MMAVEDRPARQRGAALPVIGVEHQIDDRADAHLAAMGGVDHFGDAAGDRVRHAFGEGRLEAGRRSEMVEQVGVGAADSRADRLQRHRLRAGLQQQRAGGIQCGLAAGFGGEAASY